MTLKQIFDTCEYSYCKFTRDRRSLQKVDALIFHVGISNEMIGKVPPIETSLRNPNQVWIFTSSKSQVDYFNTDFALDSWRNTMNL
jgi:hypothetical protein